jgi:hypothetical protein
MITVSARGNHLEGTLDTLCERVRESIPSDFAAEWWWNGKSRRERLAWIEIIPQRKSKLKKIKLRVSCRFRPGWGFYVPPSWEASVHLVPLANLCC